MMKIQNILEREKLETPSLENIELSEQVSSVQDREYDLEGGDEGAKKAAK
mgnify:CR=1 FL=1